MGKVYPHIDDRLREWMLAQPVFFVATAPLDVDAHVNASPKGLVGSFARGSGRTPSPIRTSQAAASRPSLTCARTVASS